MLNNEGPKFPADLVTFTEEILNGKLHFLCSGFSYFLLKILEKYWETRLLFNFNILTGISSSGIAFF